MSINIMVEAHPGSEIEDVAKETMELANKLNVPVEFMFSEVRCYSRPGEDPQGLIKECYSESKKHKSQHPFASSKPFITN